MKTIKQHLFEQAIKQIISSKTLRNVAVKELNKHLYKSIINDSLLFFHEQKMDRYHFLKSISVQVMKNLDRAYLNGEVVRKMVKVFVGNSFNSNRLDNLNITKLKYKEKYGSYPPKFLVLSPEKACNLKCTGCYASCEPGNSTHLSFDVTRRIVQEAHDIMGSRFITISGGEPLMYRSQGKTILDLFEEYNDVFFLMYTNGTLLDKKTSKRLAELGNVTPAISLEGYEMETDERRGSGVYKKIQQSLQNLREVGVPFGISVTATSKNYELLLSDDFYKYYFDTMGATYMWQFQLMPIGKGKDVMDLMVTPKQRAELYKKWDYVTRVLEYPFADFWNSASLSSGCIAYGRWNGYFYINFEGKVSPCVFVPFYEDKIQDIYARGGNLADALQSKLFKNGRRWQKDYGFDNHNNQENLLMPCSFRDHYKNFKENILTADSKSIDHESESVLTDREYDRIMMEYDAELGKLTERIFEDKFLDSKVLEPEN